MAVVFPRRTSLTATTALTARPSTPPPPTVLAFGREQTESAGASRDAATVKSAELVVQTTGDSHDATARAAVAPGTSAGNASARIIATAPESSPESVAVAAVAPPASQAETGGHASFFHLASMAQTLAGPVELLGRVIAGAAPSVIPDVSAELGSISDLSVGQATFLGLAPLRILPGDEAGQVWCVTAGVSLVVTAIGYWYCQTNPLQARKRGVAARTMILNNRRDRDAAFPM